MGIASFSARLDYGINLKSLVPDLTSDDVQDIFGEIQEAHKKVKEIMNESNLKSVLKVIVIGNSVGEEDDRTSDIIFYFNDENEIYENGISLIKHIDLNQEEYKSNFQCECLLLLKELGYPQEYEITPNWILSLYEN